MQNTIIPQSVLQKFSEHYQAHLERISDYLLPGPGVWWKPTTQSGIMFLDGSNEDEHRLNGPTLQHFRSMSSPDIEGNSGKLAVALELSYLPGVCVIMDKMGYWSPYPYQMLALLKLQMMQAIVQVQWRRVLAHLALLLLYLVPWL